MERVGSGKFENAKLVDLEVTNSYDAHGNSSMGSNILDLFGPCDDLRNNKSIYNQIIPLFFEKLGRNSLNITLFFEIGSSIFIDYLRAENFFFLFNIINVFSHANLLTFASAFNLI